MSKSKMDQRAVEEVRNIIKELGELPNQGNMFAATFNRIVNLEAKVFELEAIIKGLTAGKKGK